MALTPSSQTKARNASTAGYQNIHPDSTCDIHYRLKEELEKLKTIMLIFGLAYSFVSLDIKFVKIKEE